MEYQWLIITALAIIIFLRRKDLRKEMLFAGAMSLPVLVVKPLTSANFYEISHSNGGLLFFFLFRGLISFSFGALASSIYEAFFHKRITPKKHPHRKKMLWLLTGIFVFIILFFALNISFSISAVTSLAVDLILVVGIRKDLVWDLIFSGYVMGFLYMAIFLIVYSNMPGDIKNLWFSGNISGLTILSLPIEEIIAVILFGSLWGPIYVAIKDSRED